MDNPVTFSDITLLNTLATCASYLMGHSETATTLHYLRNVNKRKNDRLAFQNLGISS